MRLLHTSLLLLPALLAATATTAQVERNVKKLGQFHPATGTQPYNDVWGYVNPTNGKEYAILGAIDGCYVVDCSDPSKPVQRGFFSYSLSPGWQLSTWRDMKTYGSWLYVVQERGGAGMQIIDLSDPDKPRYVKTWNGGWSNAHNIAMDQQNGIAAVVGSGSSTYLIDVKTDPQNPRLITRYVGNYQHDVSIQNGLMHGAAIYAGNYEILDISKLPQVTKIGSAPTPRRFTHATWPTYDDKYCVTVDEWYRGPLNGGLAIFDIANRSQPKLLAEYKAGPPLAIAHNCFIRDYVVHLSHYTEGYRAIDISDPKNPVEVGFYDTWPRAVTGTGDFNGAWGCYHLQPSGAIYISDRTTGLYVLKPRATGIRYGSGTAGTGSKVPVAHTIGASWLGNTSFQLGVREARPSAPAVLVLGGKRASVNLGGLTLNVDLVTPPPVIVVAGTDTGGAALLPLPIPNDPKLGSLVLDLQWFVVDAAGKLGLAASRGLELELFTK